MQKQDSGGFSDSVFQKPTAKYRAAPFWAWNCKLSKEALLRQVDQFREMGMGGFHIHSRVGLDTKYLGSEFMDCVKACCEKAEEQGMLCRLYDEDRWPSGSAGGYVTKDPAYRSRFLTMTPRGFREDGSSAYMATAKAVRSGSRVYLGSYSVVLDGEGFLSSYQRVDQTAGGPGAVWDAYLEISGDTPWFNNQAYVNTLDKKAIDRFLEITYEKYYRLLGRKFGNEIPSIFTDEPQTCQKDMLRDPFEKKVVVLPFTDDFEETFRARYGISVLEHLPELLWEKKNGVSQVRYRYHAHVCERFAEAFGDNVGSWCEKHGILLTGHMMNEWTLYSQTMSMGDVMRPMKRFGIPGVDMLCDRRELSTVKQAASVSHQMGRSGTMSELYGVTGWDFDFRKHKLAGDWQAALGVTLRVPHLTWASMEGEAKRDYPASIGRQSPWYAEYPYIEDHFARVGTALTRGTPIIRVAVIHPIESYWLYWGNQRQTAVVRQDLETNFGNVIRWLLYGLIDFDFVSESMLSEDGQSCVGAFRMGKMEYEAVVVPECRTLRGTTLKKLKEFSAHGGRVVFMGEPPRYADAALSGEPSALAARCVRIPFERGALLEALKDLRDLDVESRAVEGEDPTRMKHWENGVRSNNLFYQLRRDGGDRWLFLAHVDPPKNWDVTFVERLDIRVRGKYQPVLYDTMTGKIQPLSATIENGRTHISCYCSQCDSLLLRLKRPQKNITGLKPVYVAPENRLYLPEPETYSLEEKNAVLLDQAEFAFDGGSWRPREEILRIDNLFRRKLGYPLRMEALAQPWASGNETAAVHTLRMRFRIFSHTAVEEIRLAMEQPETASAVWNNTAVSTRPDGWFVDESIRTLLLPGGLRKGENLLELFIPFGPKTNVEWCYLLGGFGVEVTGKRAEIVKLPEALYYGDIVTQRLPFYTGNLVYEVPFFCGAGRLYVEIPQYCGALAEVGLDGAPIGKIALPPYRLDCGPVEKGRHVFRFRVFGNRGNAFGALHNTDATENWYGPNLWRTEGNKWCYEYQFKKMGILTTPAYWVEKK